MSDQVFNALAATTLGLVVAVLLLVPTAAVQYRRDGRLGVGDLATLVGAAVYGLALWTYTLLPFPAEGAYRCQPSRLSIWTSLQPVLDHGLLPLSQLMRQVAFQQLAFNVLLFVPLGFFVRLVLHRGVVAATVLGALVSLAIETTQRTGVWGLYDCPYRTFDVDDLITNTAGALIGGVLAWLVLREDRHEPERLPTRITLGRRWVGFVSDVVFLVVVGGAAGVLWRAAHRYAADAGPPDRTTTAAVQVGVPLLAEALLVLLAGRTVGEWAISVRAVARRLPAPVARVVKLVAGIGGFAVLAVPDLRWGGALLAAFVVVTLVASVGTREHRGLSHWLAGMDLRISR
ncbi:VanZ family protein [Nocardioides sp.]|uniref:VanZ family protein n=1 Tax=Nocardioides sp. TaxID=35761 RepID=UPI00352968BE